MHVIEKSAPAPACSHKQPMLIPVSSKSCSTHLHTQAHASTCLHTLYASPSLPLHLLVPASSTQCGVRPGG
eukprot:1138016-Pelagomonas_calceolata.AAC.2